MNRDEKAQQIAELKEKLQKSAAIVLADYRGLTVPAVTALREEFRKQQCNTRSIKHPSEARHQGNAHGKDGQVPRRSDGADLLVG